MKPRSRTFTQPVPDRLTAAALVLCLFGKIPAKEKGGIRQEHQTTADLVGASPTRVCAACVLCMGARAIRTEYKIYIYKA